MPTFTLLHKAQKNNADGSVTIKTRQHTKAELAELRENNPAVFITVPESHAADVIRPQGKYQEVEDVVENSSANGSGRNGPADGGAGNTDDAQNTSDGTGETGTDNRGPAKSPASPAKPTRSSRKPTPKPRGPRK